MRIAEISAFSEYSVGKIMRDIKGYIDSKTDDVCELFYARGTKNSRQGMHYFGNRFRIGINAFFARVLDNDGFCFKQTTKSLVKALKKFKPDIVHIHCLHGYYMNVNVLFNYLSTNPHIKVVWTMHDAWAFTGHCCYFDMINCQKWNQMCFSCPLQKEYPKSNVLDCSTKNYIKKRRIFNSLEKNRIVLVSPSNWLANLINHSFLKEYKTIVIRNGINTNVFNSNNQFEKLPQLSKKKILLGVASVWDKRKGLDAFIKISEQISSDWQIVLIGRIIGKFSFPKNITHIEKTSDQGVLKAYYQNATVLLNPTLDDNLPTVNLEAQACGCCVITYDTGGCKETNCGNMIVVKKGDIDGIIRELNNSENFQKKDIEISQLSVDTMASKYYSLFLNLARTK